MRTLIALFHFKAHLEGKRAETVCEQGDQLNLTHCDFASSRLPGHEKLSILWRISCGSTLEKGLGHWREFYVSVSNPPRSPVGRALQYIAGNDCRHREGHLNRCTPPKLRSVSQGSLLHAPRRVSLKKCLCGVYVIKTCAEQNS